MPIFPTTKQHQMRTKTYMSPIKINQYNLLQVKKSSDTSAILRNRKLQTDRHNLFKSIEHGRKYPGSKTQMLKRPSLLYFCTRDYLPDNIRPGYDPLKEVYICWGPPFNLKYIDLLEKNVE